MRAKGIAGLLIAAVAALGVAAAGPAQAQEGALGGFNLDGGFEAGVRFLPNEPPKSERGKFNEYRDISDGFFLAGLKLRIFSPDDAYSTEITGRNWGYEDQEFGMRTGRLGLWELGFGWDQTPHVISTTGRTLEREAAPGVWTLPLPRPALQTFNGAPNIEEIGFRNDTARTFLTFTPTPDLELRAEYTRIKKDGTKPISMVFGASPGFNFVEVLEPIDHTIHDVRLRGTIARDNWQLQVGYMFSAFENANRVITIDNPCFGQAATTPCGATNTAAATTSNAGLAALPPNNMAHTFFAQGGVSNLPLRTRITGNFSYSIQLQNDPFVAQTVNPLALNAANAQTLLALPRKSLEGDTRNTLFNFGINSRPISPLTLNLKYRYFDLSDHTDSLVFQDFVGGDRPTLPLVGEPENVPRHDYARHNVDFDARYRIANPLAVTLGTGWERWNRSASRDVQRSDEVYVKAAVDATPFDWLLARLTYRPSVRRTGEYRPGAHIEQLLPDDPTAAEEEIAIGNHPHERRFDEAARNRQRVDLLLQLSPFETLTVSPNASWRDDDYTRSHFGLQRETSLSAGLDVSWNPFERLALTAGYTHEVNFQKFRSRNRPVVEAGGVATIFDFPDFEWLSDMTDTVDTIFFGLNVGVIPKVLDWMAGASFSTSTGRTENRNPNGTPTSGTAAQRVSATASPWPAFNDELIRFDTALRYHFLKNWTASLGYVFESFQQTDWRTDQVNPFIGVDSIWLGMKTPSYTAHIVGLTLGYQFGK